MRTLFTGTSELSFKKPKIRIYPNPFTDKTSIIFEFPDGYKEALLIICDVQGQRVKQFKLFGQDELKWDGTDSNGNRVNEGLYFCTLIVDNKIISTKKLIFTQ